MNTLFVLTGILAIAFLLVWYGGKIRKKDSEAAKKKEIERLEIERLLALDEHEIKVS